MPKTILPDARVSPRFAGIATFCRYPRVEDVADENMPLDWAIYGAPFDAGVTYRPGARFGPRAIREASQYVKRFHTRHNVDVCERLSLADAGDAPVSPYSSEETLDLIEDFASSLSERTSVGPAGPVGASGSEHVTKLMAIGGDHSIAYANIRATYSRCGEPRSGLALVHFDSHMDTVDSLWGSRWSHASPFRRVIEEGFVDPTKMICVGLKGPLNAAADYDFARQSGVTMLSYDDLFRAPSGSLASAASVRGALNFGAIDAFVQRIAKHPAYVTFDVDVVDPAFAPGTGTPCPGGLSSAEAFDLLRRLAGINIVGADVVEVLPDRDVSGITAFLAAHVMFELLALDAVGRG